MTITERMTEKLEAALAPAHLEVQDVSEKHRGHGGYREGGETHFHLVISSAAFAGKNRVQQQRMIYDIVAAEMDERVHALSMELSTPDAA